MSDLEKTPCSYDVDVLCGFSANWESTKYYHDTRLSKKTVHRNHRTVAGSTVNSALGFLAYGCQARSLVTIGDDDFGEFVMSYLKKRQPELNIRFLPWREETPDSAVAVRSDGQRLKYLAYKPPYVEERVANGLHLITEEVYKHRPRVRLATGVRTADVPMVKTLFANGLCPSVRVLSPGTDLLQEPGLLRELLADTDLLSLNGEELGLLQATFDLGELSQVHNLGPSEIIVTYDIRGALLSRTGRDPIVQPAFQVEALDATGAGDHHLCTFLGQRLQGKSDDEALRFAAAAAAMQTTLLGGSAIPCRSDIEALLEHGRLREEAELETALGR